MTIESKAYPLPFNFDQLSILVKKNFDRKLVDLRPESGFIRYYVINSNNSALLVKDVPEIVPDYSDTIYVIDLPKDFRNIVTGKVISRTRISYIHDTESLIRNPKSPQGYRQHPDYNARSSLLIGIVCGQALSVTED